MPKKKTQKKPLGRCQRTGKVKFRNRGQAESEIRYRQALHPDTQHPVRTYRCEHCHKWHLTSREKYVKVEE